MSRTARTAGRVTRKPAPAPHSSAPDAAIAAPPPAAAEAARDKAALTLRIDLGRTADGPAEAIGPGKVRLLELIAETGSISAAGRAMGMSYRQAWLLVDSMNQAFAEPVTTALRGGAKGGGASITAFGLRLAARYRVMERKAAEAVADDLAALQSALARPGE